MSEIDLASSEKRSVALSSVLAAAGLTALKIIVGVLSGSLGILAEAAHSGLDLAAALVTLFAVRASGKPADADHTYGHGKFETLSAFFETLLLLATCVWIVSEAVHRLIAREISVDASIWTFAVMAVSIVVDVSRSRMLYAAARKHGSEALEADALHFSTDIWSSAAVLCGLLCVKLAEWFPSLDFLKKADALAALFVAGIVVWVSLKLGRRAIDGLLDAAPEGAVERVRAAAESVPGVLNVHGIRVRRSGPGCFADLHIVLASETPFQQVHETVKKVEAAIEKVLPCAKVLVRPQPKK